MKSLFEQMGGTYRQEGDYLIPNLIPPDTESYSIGKYGRMRRTYLREHRKVFYTSLVVGGTLFQHLEEIDRSCNEQMETIISGTQLPNFLFEAPIYQPLSNEAKLLYAFILRRTDLSRKNGWADEYGRIYLYYPICEVVGLLRCGRQKAVNTLRELQYAELIDIKKQGCGKTNRIYPKSYAGSSDS